MFDLAYPIQDIVDIDGEEYHVNLAFDNVLRLFDMLNDDDLSDEHQIEIGLEMLIGYDPDLNIFEKRDLLYTLFEATLGDTDKEEVEYDIEGNPMPVAKHDEDDGSENPKKTYSIKQDARYIYASFYQDYGIDLFEMQGKLHWVKFNALLEGLRPDTKFKEVVGIRTMDLPKGKGSQKHRNQVQKAKEAYRLKPE